MSAVADGDERLATYRGLMGVRWTFGEHALASMLASHMHGRGAMPACLGLDARMFGRMLDHHFPGIGRPDAAAGGGPWDMATMPEYHELKALFTEHQAAHLGEQPWWIEIMIVGCSGRNHLWEDLGLFTRRDLTRLMHELFPGLAARNDRDMKWKKFLYKQLCDREGIVACPAPSCDACAHFSECFSSEG
jgi:nitrogen fixation protein NifQ